MRLLRLTSGLLILSLSPIPLFAAENVSESCLNTVYAHMAHEERLYRSVLFGQKQSDNLPTGSVRHDHEFHTWMKTEDNEWKSLDVGFTTNPLDDIAMDDGADVPPRRGLFEVRSAPTSDLLPPLLQSMRALQCRLRAVCAAARLSQTEGRPSPLSVQIEGCKDRELPVFEACAVKSIASISGGGCEQAVDAIIERESTLLNTVIAYDSAYRTLAQFAGVMEGFLTDFRFPLLEPLWQMVRTLGSLDNLPCFSGQCDE